MKASPPIGHISELANLPLAILTRREARRLVPTASDTLPALAQALRQLGARAVCITGDDSDDGGDLVLDWLATEHATGWITSPRIASVPPTGSSGSLAAHASAMLALGFVAADATLLARMTASYGLRRHQADCPVTTVAPDQLPCDPTLLPTLSWSEQPCPAPGPARRLRPLGLYAIVDSIERLQQVLAAGVRSVQLRIKTPAMPDARWHAALRTVVSRNIDACRAASAELFINDHWELALELGADGVHLGQEDLLALGDDGRARLRTSGLALGLSSHSVWELCRARALSPRYIACGPVWPTLTKAMPWHPQGLHNLAWWQGMAQCPVVAIGGILEPAQVQAAARTGVDGVCIVRALGDDPAVTVPVLQRAFASGRARASAQACPALPRPSLPTGTDALE